MMSVVQNYHSLIKTITEMTQFKMPHGTYTGKNNGLPFLDILGYLKNTHKNPKLEERDKSQSGNLVGNSLVGTCLTLTNLGFLWVFFKCPKISINGNPLFFPVI